MSTLFDAAFNRAKTSDIEGLARTIWMMTAIEVGKDAVWDISEQKILICLMHYEADVASKMEKRPRSMVSLYKLVEQGLEVLEPILRNDEAWINMTENFKLLAVQGLAMKLAVASRVPDLDFIMQNLKF